MRLFDPDEDAEDGFRYRHFALSADTALWNGFEAALGHALRTTDLSMLEAFFRTHEGAASRADAERKVSIGTREFLAALDGAEQTLTLAVAALDVHDPENAIELAKAAQARTHDLPRLRALAKSGPLEFPRSAWMQMAALRHQRLPRLLKLGAPQIIIANELYNASRALLALLTPPLPGGPFGWFEDSTWRDQDEPVPDALQRLQSAADCCLDLCVGDWAPNLGLGAAVACLGLLDDEPFDDRPLRAAYTSEQGIHLDFVELGFDWFSVSERDDAVCVASGDELAQFVEQLERPFDLREAWNRQPPEGDEDEAPDSLDRRAEDLGFESFAAAERLFGERLARYRAHCRATLAEGRTLLAWTRRSGFA